MKTEAEKQALISELCSDKVQLYCGLHNYFGPAKNGVESKPAKGCQRCWFVFYFYDIASTSPELRAQRLDELDEVLHKTVELVNQGKWDFEPYRHAKVETEFN